MIAHTTDEDSGKYTTAAIKENSGTVWNFT